MDIRKEAVSLRDEVARATGVTPAIRWGGFGQLDVLVDGRLVFSKKAVGRMPERGEIPRLMREARA